MEFIVRKKIDQLMRWTEEGHITFTFHRILFGDLVNQGIFFGKIAGQTWGFTRK